MTDNEIIKALKRCINGTGKCNLCPMFENCKTDINALEKHTLDLINRQQAEIERLKPFEKKIVASVLENIKQLEYEKAEAIKEFERKSEKKLIELYEKYHKIANKPKRETDMFYQGRAEAIWECIDTNRNLVKEMMEVE